MKILTGADVIRTMNEEWNARVKRVIESSGFKVRADVDGDNDKESIISPELKIIHKKSKIRYTVDSVGLHDVVLRTPEGEKMLVDSDVLEREYEID